MARAHLGLFLLRQARPSRSVFSDFDCPYSSKNYFILEKLEARYPTQLRVVFKHDPLDIHPNVRLAHQAGLAAGRQGKFAPMAELLFANQDKQDEGSLLRYAARLRLDMARFRRDLHSVEIAALLQTDQSEGDAFGVQVTPTMYLNGHLFSGFQSEATLTAAIDKEAAIKAAAPAALLAEATLPAAMLAELQESPTAATGAANAPLTIVEFTDFQCPFCRLAAVPMEQFMAVRGREVRWAVRTFPLDIHPDAQLAAEAAGRGSAGEVLGDARSPVCASSGAEGCGPARVC
jgi:protein-disulfide isomerase